MFIFAESMQKQRGSVLTLNNARADQLVLRSVVSIR